VSFVPSRHFSMSEILELATHFVRRTVTAVFTAAVDISYGPLALKIGADALGSTRTDATNKTARVAAAHYLNAEEPPAIATLTSTATANTVFWGGGTGVLNTVTEHRWYTAANTTTTTGTRRMTIAADGNIGIGQPTPTARLHLPAGVSTAGGAPLKLTAGTNLATPENGALEFDGTNLWLTVGGVRKQVTLV
jgi:hypothetical protein